MRILVLRIRSHFQSSTVNSSWYMTNNTGPNFRLISKPILHKGTSAKFTVGSQTARLCHSGRPHLHGAILVWIFMSQMSKKTHVCNLSSGSPSLHIIISTMAYQGKRGRPGAEGKTGKTSIAGTHLSRGVLEARSISCSGMRDMGVRGTVLTLWGNSS